MFSSFLRVGERVPATWHLDLNVYPCDWLIAKLLTTVHLLVPSPSGALSPWSPQFGPPLMLQLRTFKVFFWPPVIYPNFFYPSHTRKIIFCEALSIFTEAITFFPTQTSQIFTGSLLILYIALKMNIVAHYLHLRSLFTYVEI